MTTLQEWLDRLEEFDPDDWGEIGALRTKLSEEELYTDLEAEITFRTACGQYHLNKSKRNSGSDILTRKSSESEAHEMRNEISSSEEGRLPNP
jgi:hypothetical protein